MVTLAIYALSGWLLAILANKLFFDKKPIKKSFLIIVLGLVAIASILIGILSGFSTDVVGAHVGVFIVILYSFITKYEMNHSNNAS